MLWFFILFLVLIVISAFVAFLVRLGDVNRRSRIPWDKHTGPAKFECPGCGGLLETCHNNPRWLEALQRAKSVSPQQAKAMMKRTGRCPICDGQASQHRDDREEAAPTRRVVRKPRTESSAGLILGLSPLVWVIIGVGGAGVLLFGFVFVLIAVQSGPQTVSLPPGPAAPPKTNPGPLTPGPLPPPPPDRKPPSAVKMPGLLAYWSFDADAGGSAADTSGRGLKAKLVNVEQVPGIRGRALSFSGQGTYFDYGDSPDLSFKAKAPFTLAFWVQTRIATGTLLSQRNSRDGSPVIDILISGGRLAGQVRCDGNEFANPVQIDSKSMNDGNWHHVALTRDGDVLELFLDSVSQGRKSGAAAGGAITTNLRSLGSERYWINHRPGPGDPHFQGNMDEFCIFSRVLKAEEITMLAGR